MWILRFQREVRQFYETVRRGLAEFRDFKVKKTILRDGPWRTSYVSISRFKRKVRQFDEAVSGGLTQCDFHDIK